MKCTIENLARRPISLHCNSGKTLHLPSAYVLELPEEEVQGNAMIEKLKSRKLILLKMAKTTRSTKGRRNKQETESNTKVSDKATAKSAKK